MLADLISETMERRMKSKLNRKGTEIRFLKFGGWLNFYDLFKLTTEGSLMKLAQLLGLDGKTRTGLKKDLTVPYTYFSSVDRLLGTEVPPLEDPCWLSLKDGEPMIGRAEHAEVSREVAESSWYDVFSTYLRKVSDRADVFLCGERSRGPSFQDCVLVLASLLEMDSLYASKFGVDLLSCRYTSAGAVISSHLDAMINRAGVQGFSRIRNATIAKLLLRGRSGGIVESRVKRSGRLVEATDAAEAEAERVVGLDLNQLYPSMQYLYNNMIGEMTLYSDPSGSGVFEATSNLNPYSEEYKALAVYRDMLEADGNSVLSVYSNHSNEKRSLLPRYYPDAVFVTTKEGESGVTLNMFQYDGW
jgi:hypothetical protein